MDSYYDTVIRQCETLMQEGSFKEAYQQREESLSLPRRRSSRSTMSAAALCA